MDGHGQPALLYIVPFTLGKYNHLTHKFENVNTYGGILVFNMYYLVVFYCSSCLCMNKAKVQSLIWYVHILVSSQ